MSKVRAPEKSEIIKRIGRPLTIGNHVPLKDGELLACGPLGDSVVVESAGLGEGELPRAEVDDSRHELPPGRH
jgi:hypothetical protein